MTECKLAEIPLRSALDMGADKNNDLIDETPLGNVFGLLLNFSCLVRSDMSYAAG